MSVKIFPSANGVGGEPKTVFNESNLASLTVPGARNYVISGFEMPFSAQGEAGQPVELIISPGAAVIAGYYVVSDEPLTVTLPAPLLGIHIFYIYLCLSRDSLNNVTGAEMYCVETNNPYRPTPPAVDHICIGNIRSVGLSYSLGVNSAPRTPWPGLTDTLLPRNVYYATLFDSVDGMTTTGTVTHREGHVSLATTASSGATATLCKKAPDQMTIYTDQPYSIRMCVGYGNYSAVTGYAGVGTPASKKFVGISYRDGKVYGCSGDGTSLVEAGYLTNSGGSDALTADTEVIITVSDGAITWHSTKGRSVQTTTYLPPSIGDNALLYAEVKTNEAVSKSMALSYWMVAQFA